jgi:hypothetical protein
VMGADMARTMPRRIVTVHPVTVVTNTGLRWLGDQTAGSPCAAILSAA